MQSLPRSRTLPLLRTPAPFRLLAGALGWVGLCAATLAVAPPLFDRGRLGAVLIDATVTRVDPLIERAQSGHWPASGPIAPGTTFADQTDALARRITDEGIAITQARASDRVELTLSHAFSDGDTVAWRCRVEALEGSGAVAPLSLPAQCRK